MTSQNITPSLLGAADMRKSASADPALPASAQNLDINSAAARKWQPLAISNWLLAVAFIVFSIVVVGGITRLTESGLSITEWNVVTGILPPLSSAAWQSEFALYKATTEYQTVNMGMTLAQFKEIYFWEYFHRLLGRMVGIAFAVPLLYFAIRRAIPKGYGWRLVLLLILGGMQGVIGWWMVVSGLVGRTDVSHFRLSIHLLNALLIMGALIWTALDMRGLAKDATARPARVTGLALGVFAMLFVQLLFGAWVAGLNAGYISSTWPLMNDQLVPRGIDWTQGIGSAVANDPYLIHFIHRWWAWGAAAALVALAMASARHNQLASSAILIALTIQIILGIATVMSGMNITLAVLHQAVGALVVASTAFGAHVIGRPNSRARA